MTVLLEIKDLIKEFGDRVLLDKVNLKIKKGEKIGLVGSNGTGKSTLANIIYGLELANGGEIIFDSENIEIGYMKQNLYDSQDTLSGGEKAKKRLKEVLYKNYSLLILDEPTNHLDFEGFEWLIKMVNGFKGTVIMISHDRYFLDRSVDRIVEIENCKLNSYSGNYTYYREKKKQDYENMMQLYMEQEQKKRDINSQIKMLKNWSEKCHNGAKKKAIKFGVRKGGKEFYRTKAKKKDIQIKSRIKKLEKIKIEGIDKPKEEERVLFSLDDAGKTGKVLVRAENISKSFGRKVLFKNSSFYINNNEKIALFGINGCGKTTLINIILGTESTKGNIYLSPNKNIGYISQNIVFEDEDSKVIELFDYNTYEELADIRNKLSLLGFSEYNLNEPVRKLSLGERMKIKILVMINKRCDLLILDEPTNNIDIHVRQTLEDVLSEYTGSIILVSHDRYMIKRICNKILAFENKTIKRYEFGLEEYLENVRSIKSKEGSKDKCKERMVIDNKISCVIGKLSTAKIGSEEYLNLDKKYNELLQKKKELEK